MDPRERLILALDVDTLEHAVRLVRATAPYVGAYKVGLELVNAEGPAALDYLHECGAKRIFYDAKFHDIPATVHRAVRAAIRHNLWMLNVHAAGGSRMVTAAAQAIHEHTSRIAAHAERPLLVGVTLLTSMNDTELQNDLMVSVDRYTYVSRLARMVQLCGGQGVVASAWEIEAVRRTCGPEFVIVTPGVRPEGTDPADQRRTVTPAEAVRRGADYLVLGRPITGAPDPAAAARRVLEEISAEMGRMET